MFAMEQEWSERKELNQMDEQSVLSGVIRRVAVAQLTPPAFHQPSTASPLTSPTYPHNAIGSAIGEDKFFTPPNGQQNPPVLRKHLTTPPFLHEQFTPHKSPVDQQHASASTTAAREERNNRLDQLMRNLPRLDAVHWNMAVEAPREDLYDLNPEQLKAVLNAPYIPMRDRLHEIVANCAKTIEESRHRAPQMRMGQPAAPELTMKVVDLQRITDAHQRTLEEASLKYQQMQQQIDRLTNELQKLRTVNDTERTIQGKQNARLYESVTSLDAQLQALQSFEGTS